MPSCFRERETGLAGARFEESEAERLRISNLGDETTSSRASIMFIPFIPLKFFQATYWLKTRERQVSPATNLSYQTHFCNGGNPITLGPCARLATTCWGSKKNFAKNQNSYKQLIPKNKPRENPGSNWFFDNLCPPVINPSGNKSEIPNQSLEDKYGNTPKDKRLRVSGRGRNS